MQNVNLIQALELMLLYVPVPGLYHKSEYHVRVIRIMRGLPGLLLYYKIYIYMNMGHGSIGEVLK